MCIWAYSRWVECQKPGSIHLDPSPQGRKWVKACYNSNARKNCATTGISEEPFELLTGPCPQYHQQEWYREHYPHLKYNDLCRKRTPPPTQTPTQAQALKILLLTPLKDTMTLLKATTTLLKDTPTKILTLKVTVRVMETELSTLQNYNYTKMKLQEMRVKNTKSINPRLAVAKPRAKNRVKVPRTIERTLEVVVVVAAAPAVAKADATKNQSDENIDCK